MTPAMSIHAIALLISAALLWGAAVDSPLLILHGWGIGELLRLLGIFLFLYCLQYLCKKLKVKNIVLSLVLVALVLTHFELAAVASLGLLALTAGVIGRRVASNSQWIEQSDIAMHLAIGYALMIGVLQVSAHFPINTRELFTLAPIVLLSLLHRETASLSSDIAKYLRTPFRMGGTAFVLPAGVALSMLVYVALPETHSDALLANLRIAHQVRVTGMWPFDTVLYAWAAFPKGAAWLLTSHYLLAGEAAARLFNWFVILVTSLLIYREGIRLGFTTNSWLSVALFMSTPITFWCGFVLFDDAVFGLFVTAAIILTVNSSVKLTPGGVFVTLLLCSAAIATKITGLFLIPVIFALYLYRIVLVKPVNGGSVIEQQRIKYVLACLPLLVIGSMPYIFSYVQTGNPVFPLYNNIFKAENFPITRFQDLRWSADLGWDAIYKMAANTSQFMEGKNWTFGVQYALFLIPVVIELILRRKNTALLQYGLAIVVFSVFVFWQIRYVRYLYPIFPIYSILMASFLHRVSSGGLKPLVLIISILIIAINLVNVKSLNMYYSFDFKSWSPIETRRTVDYFEKSLNATVNLEYGTSAKVLYLHRPYSAGLDGSALNYNWASPVVKEAVDGAKNVSDVFRVIRKFGITHIILDEDIVKSAPTPFTRSVASIANLQRQLGSVQLWKVDTKLVAVDEAIKLNDRYAKNFLVSGWREPEPWGVWSYGDTAKIVMHLLNRDEKRPVHVKAFAMPYSPDNRIDGIKIRIMVNGRFLQEMSLRPQQIQQELSFDVPVSFMNNDDVINIEFQFPRAFDESLLQLGFSEITLEYK